MAETADAALAEVDQQASLLTGRLETSRLGVLIVIEDRTRVAAIERNLSQSRGEVPRMRRRYLTLAILTMAMPNYGYAYLWPSSSL